MLNYEYKGKVYNKTNLSDLVVELDNNNAIDMCSDTTYCIRGLDGLFGEWNVNEFLEKLVLYKFISNDGEYKRLDAIWLKEFNEKKELEAKENNEEKTNYIDAHYESVTRNIISKIGVYHY